MDSINSGYRLIYRSALDHDKIGIKKPYSEFEAWIWMILSACGIKEGRNVVRDFGGRKRMVFEPYGTLTHSTRFLAEKFGWTHRGTRSFISRLRKDEMVTQLATQQITQLTICNFDAYQNRDEAKRHSKRQIDDTATTQQRHKDEHVSTLTREQIEIGRENFVNLPPSDDGSDSPDGSQVDSSVKSKKKTVKQYADDSPEAKLTDHAIKQIHRKFASIKFDSRDKMRFNEMMNKLMRIDKWKENDIAQVIYYVTDDDEPNHNGFCWADHFQTPAKLRTKDRSGVMYMAKWFDQMNNKTNGVYK